MSSITIEHDCRGRFGAARDQGERLTCLAFAASDAHAACRGSWAPLSAEYLFFQGLKISGGDPDNGSSFSHLLKALRASGQPLESGWPYVQKLPEDLSKWKPPDDVGEVYRRHSESILSTFDAVWNLVVAGEAVVVGMTLSASFYKGEEVVNANENVESDNKHAVIAVAAGTQGRTRYILIRNSWGSEWGQLGHAWLSESYLTPRLIRVARMKEVA